MLKSIAFAIFASLSLVACIDQDEQTDDTIIVDFDPTLDEQKSPPDECASLDDAEQGCGEPE